MDVWKKEYKENNLNENHNGQEHINEVHLKKYLGIIVSKDGSNAETFKLKQKDARIAKKQIIDKLKAIPAGEFHFEVALELRKAVLHG